MQLSEHYPEMSGTKPTFKYRRMIGGGDVFVVEGTIDYGDGIPVSYVGVGEVRDGKVAVYPVFLSEREALEAAGVSEPAR